MSNLAKIVVRVRSRDGLERVTITNPTSTTVSELKSQIETQLRVPISHQTLSKNRNLLLAKSVEDAKRFADMSNPGSLISSLGITHGSIVYLYYKGERSVPGPSVVRRTFGRKMTIEELMAKQVRVVRQEKSHCESVSIDRDAANVFQHYVNETLLFAVKRCGFMYGKVVEGGKVVVDFIYEPPQKGSDENVEVLRDLEEEKLVEAVALGLGMRRVGFIFTQTVNQIKKGYTLSNSEVLQGARFHAESGMKEWVTVVVKLEAREDGGADACFEAFQMSDVCVRLSKEGWFEGNCKGKVDPQISRMKKDVIVAGKYTKEVDNDFLLVAVKIFDHQGLLSSTFPIENRDTTVTMKTVKNYLDQRKSLPFVKQISDFHLLLFLARYLDLCVEVPALAECVQMQMPVPEGYQLLIESMAGAF